MSDPNGQMTKDEETEKKKSTEIVDGDGKECEKISGTLLQCGATDYWAPGRTKGSPREDFPSLPVPHRLRALEVRYKADRGSTSSEDGMLGRWRASFGCEVVCWNLNQLDALNYTT